MHLDITRSQAGERKKEKIRRKKQRKDDEGKKVRR
jgi:hypothetical protein